MIARPVDGQKIMHRKKRRGTEAAKYLDMPRLIGYRTAAASRNPTVDFQKRCSCHDSCSRGRTVPVGVFGVSGPVILSVQRIGRVSPEPRCVSSVSYQSSRRQVVAPRSATTREKGAPCLVSAG